MGKSKKVKTYYDVYKTTRREWPEGFKPGQVAITPKTKKYKRSEEKRKWMKEIDE